MGELLPINAEATSIDNLPPLPTDIPDWELPETTNPYAEKFAWEVSAYDTQKGFDLVGDDAGFVPIEIEDCYFLGASDNRYLIEGLPSQEYEWIVTLNEAGQPQQVMHSEALENLKAAIDYRAEQLGFTNNFTSQLYNDNFANASISLSDSPEMTFSSEQLTHSTGAVCSVIDHEFGHYHLWENYPDKAVSLSSHEVETYADLFALRCDQNYIGSIGNFVNTDIERSSLLAHLDAPSHPSHASRYNVMLQAAANDPSLDASERAALETAIDGFQKKLNDSGIYLFDLNVMWQQANENAIAQSSVDGSLSAKGIDSPSSWQGRIIDSLNKQNTVEL